MENKVHFSKRRKPKSLRQDSLGKYLFLSFGGAFMALPLVYVILNAFKPLDELFVFPPQFFVRNPTLDNFFDLFTLMSDSWVPFSRYLVNTLLITGVGTAGQVILASMAAYALAKRNFPGKNIIFQSIVLALMFSSRVTTIPSYLIMSELKWIDTYAAVIVPAFQSSLGLYLIKQFMESNVPNTLLEAARIDGAGEFRIWGSIVMPMVKPAWLTLIIMSVQNLWNVSGSTYLYSEQLKPLTVALANLSDGGIARAGVSAAVSVVMMIVPVTMFVMVQSRVLETMATSGMKG